MTFNDSLRRIIKNQVQQEKKIGRLKVAERSARTDDLIRKQVDDEGSEYVEIGLDLVDHAQLVPNGSFNDGETGWKIELRGDPGAGSWYHWFGLSELNVGIEPLEKCTASIECVDPIYLRSTGVIHEYHMFYVNANLGNIYFIEWTLSVTEYTIDDEVVTVNSVTLTNPALGVDLDLYGTFTPSAQTAYVKIMMSGVVPNGIQVPTDMQSIIDGVSLKGLGTGQELIEANATRTTLKSVWVDLGIVSATNINATPTANYIPKADGAGKIAAGWLPDLSGTYLGVSAKAADADKLDGIDSTGFSLVNHAHNTFSTSKFVPLANPLSSPSWTIGTTSYSNTIPTLIDLSSVFGAPAGIKAVSVRLVARDSAVLHNTGLYVALGPSATRYYELSVHPVGGDIQAATGGVVNCNDDGDIYYAIAASGTNTMDVQLEIWGYWIDQTGLPTGLYEDAQVSAYRDATTFAFSSSGAIYSIPLNVESFDTHSFHDNSTNPSRFTCTKAGTYMIVGMVTFAANATGNRDAGIWVNQIYTAGFNRLPAATSGTTSVPVSGIAKLNVGDYVELWGRQYSGGSLDAYYANALSNYLTMVLITESPVDAWQDWTPTVTGWAAGYTVNVARYKLIGKTCFFTLDISGTSNSTAVTVTMPFTSYSGAGDPVWGGTNAYVQNGGTVATTSASRWYIGENSAIITAHTNMSTGTWTATGAKRIRVTGFYEIA